ncbi:MAG TPA: adenylate/guanylate cyclase domain-containing protein [Stellaceae bacterium]|nr:adenylate/guanylate cyclase domain-containing protein [Stellaceae bacterium]
MRFTIGTKIFSIAVALLVLMGAAAALSLRMTRTLDGQLVVIDHNYFPAFVSLARANVDTLREALLLRRLLVDLDERNTAGGEPPAELQKRIEEAANGSDAALVAARKNINEQITDWLSFDDDVALARLDTQVEFLQEERLKYAALAEKIRSAFGARQLGDAFRLLRELEDRTDDLVRRMDAYRSSMRQIARDAIGGTRAYQQRLVEISTALLVLAGLLGLLVAGGVTMGLVRPVRRLLHGTEAVEQGMLDTVVPVTSRDEIGQLTRSFNSMVGELRIKEKIRDTFGKYVDPRIVAGLIERPELTDPRGARREMTILFCDMQGFTSFSEEMTAVGLVNVLNRYLTVLSEPVRRNNGIIDKYIGDAVMAFWGPPFAPAEDQARLACLAALEQLAALPGFQDELPELTGVRRGFPQVRMRVGIATGDVVVGNIGSEQIRNYTVIGDTVNTASRLEGASKAYGTRILIGERTRELAADAIEVREIDSVLVVGKHRPERIFELLGRKGQVPVDRLELRDTFAAALADYRDRNWDRAGKGFRDCLTIVPDDTASQVFLDRIAQFRAEAPAEDWDGVWALHAK